MINNYHKNSFMVYFIFRQLYLNIKNKIRFGES